MVATARGLPAGIVFRRLDAIAERHEAARLLPDCALDDHDLDCQWFGLCDLTATTTSGLAGVAVVRCLDPTTARLCGLAMTAAYREGSLVRRLVSEVADRLRAAGVEELTASPVLDDQLAGLLRQEGFAVRGEVLGRGPGPLSLPL